MCILINSKIEFLTHFETIFCTRINIKQCAMMTSDRDINYTIENCNASYKKKIFD